MKRTPDVSGIRATMRQFSGSGLADMQRRGKGRARSAGVARLPLHLGHEGSYQAGTHSRSDRLAIVAGPIVGDDEFAAIIIDLA